MKKYNQFTAFKALSRASFSSLLKRPSSIVFGIVFPLIFILVFGFLGDRGIKIRVGESQFLDTATLVYQQLSKESSIDFVPFDSIQEEQLKKGNLDALLSITKENNVTKVSYKISDVSLDKSRVFELILKQIAQEEIINSSGELPKNIEIRKEEIKGKKFTIIDFILPGQLGFALLSTGVFGTAFVFLSLRQTLVIKRFFATPVKRTVIILAEANARLLFSLAGSVIIIILGYYLFGFTLANGLISAIEMILLCALSLVVFMGIGFTISGIASSESVVPPLSNLVTLPQFLLSGSFFSTELFPGWLQTISNFLPLTHLNIALRKIAFDGYHLIDVWMHVLVLLIWGVLIYLMAGKFFKWE
jgi:ABC-2 type transport system permease protein